MQARSQHDPKGFTLIELLVVLAVIALLISLLLPSLGRARQSSKGIACLANLRSIGQALVIYLGDSKERFPLSSHTAGSVIDPTAWLQSLEPYGVIPAARICPADPYRTQRATSYATNEHFEPLTPWVDFNPVTGQPLPGGRTFVFDRLGLIPRPYAVVYAMEPEGEGLVDHLNTHQFASAHDVAAAIAVRRHLDATNFVFVDGHARTWAWSNLKAVFTPSTSPFDPQTAR